MENNLLLEETGALVDRDHSLMCCEILADILEGSGFFEFLCFRMCSDLVSSTLQGFVDRRGSEKYSIWAKPESLTWHATVHLQHLETPRLSDSCMSAGLSVSKVRARLRFLRGVSNLGSVFSCFLRNSPS